MAVESTSAVTALLGDRRGLIIVAAPLELAAVRSASPLAAPGVPAHDWQDMPINRRWTVVQSGVGKVNAALCASRFVDPSTFGVVINLGIAGTLHPELALMRSIVVADRSIYADEGIVSPDGGFMDMSAAGFGPGGVPPAFSGMGIPGDRELMNAVSRACTAADLPWRSGGIATVSTCSGADAHARAVADRTNALAECMEGAAIGHAIARCVAPDVRFAEVRVISNTTGDREKQVWDLRGSLHMLTRLTSAIISDATE